MKEGLTIVTGNEAQPAHEAMAKLWSLATELGLNPTQFRLGFFAHRAAQEARQNLDREGRWQRLEQAWGCGVATVSFDFSIQLSASGHLAGCERKVHILEWKAE